jgi:ABC-2 type transport system permease protein
MSASASSWTHTVWQSFVRSWRQARRTPALAFVFPVVPALAMVAVYAELLSRMSDLPGFPAPSYVDFMAAGAITVVPMTGAAFSGMALAGDIRGGYIERIRLLPVSPIAFLGGRVLFDAVRMLPAVVAVLAVAGGLGADYGAGPAGWLAVAVMVMLWTIAYSGLFLLIAVRTRSPEAVQAAFPIFAPLTFLSTVWFPRNLMPQWAEAVAGVNPVTAVADGIRDVLADGFGPAPVLVAVGSAVAVAIVLQALTTRSLVTVLQGD